MDKVTIADAIEWFEIREASESWSCTRALYDLAIAALRTQEVMENSPGEISDGYHTFNELYHHRAVLFSVICNQHPKIAWKSKKHNDGTMYDGMFIVGIETPEGPATYHYDVDPYWDMFHVPEVENAPKWDGHTPEEAIRRIGTITDAKESKPLTLADELMTIRHRLEQVERERDTWQRRAEAAKRDIETLLMEGCAGCDFCAKFETCSDEDRAGTYCKAKWRGPCAGNGGIK